MVGYSTPHTRTSTNISKTLEYPKGTPEDLVKSNLLAKLCFHSPFPLVLFPQSILLSTRQELDVLFHYRGPYNSFAVFDPVP